jgi:hypothetical protein
VDIFIGQNVDGLDVVFIKESAVLVSDGSLVRQHGYMGQLLPLCLWLFLVLECLPDVLYPDLGSVNISDH